MELINTLLLKAVQGETDAEERYLAFARQAELDGYPGVAVLFTGLSHAEAVHIANHTRALEKNGYKGSLPSAAQAEISDSTLTNLQLSLEGELEEFTTMYPSYRKQITRKHGREFIAKIALLSIKWAAESEKNHHELLNDAIQRVRAGEDLNAGELYLCTVCGNLHYSPRFPEGMCTICGHDPMFFSKVSVLP